MDTYDKVEMKRIEFHDREKEIKEMKSILECEPSLITFIYGSINSDKTELINHLLQQLPQDYVCSMLICVIIWREDKKINASC